MAKNDKVLVDGIVDDRVAMKLPSDRRDEAFEYLCFEQIMKDFDLSGEELTAGSVDGGRDGGIDGIFILINGHLLLDPESFTWPKTNSELRVRIVTCKHHDTFQQAPLDSLVATLSELLDFKVEDNQLKGAYSEAILRVRNNLRYAYRKLSPRLTTFKIEMFYASRGSSEEIGTEVQARAEQLKSLVADLFGPCHAHFQFFGSTELVEAHRKIPNYALELPFVEALAKGERYVVLVRLSDYYRFISDDGKLRRYLFESNVRDFMGMNRVNEDIKTTLENPSSPDFWLLNNGVTILANAASITGKSIQATEIQIVNGLQTTESIFRHYEGAQHGEDDRCLLVKVIVSKDEAVRDSIIRATNNQTAVEFASLHATDKIQRDIEDIMLRHGLFFERRKNYYTNQGHPPAEIVTPLYAASGFVALILKMPHKAATLRSKFMRSPDSYATVFSEKSPLEVWPKVAGVLKRVDLGLELLRPKVNGAEYFLKRWRYIIAFQLVAEVFGRYTFSAKDLCLLDIARITDQDIERVWLELNQISKLLRARGGWTSRANVIDACQRLSVTKNISGMTEIFHWKDALSTSGDRGENAAIIVTDEFVAKVKEALPLQPWKPGIHRKVCAELNCDISSYNAAVGRLIDDGVFYQQVDGVLFDNEGNVVSFDPLRVDPETLTLLEKVKAQ